MSELRIRCLNEYSFVCRSISYDSTSRTCSLSRYTRRTHPEQYEDDPGFEYLENTCLSGNFRFISDFYSYLGFKHSSVITE